MRTSLQSHLPIDCTGDRQRTGMLAVTGRMCRCAIAVGIFLIVIPGSTVSVSQAFASQSPDDEAPHRLLPLPDGKNADASAQAMLLRQLQGIMRQQPGERPPQVSPGSSSQPDNAPQNAKAREDHDQSRAIHHPSRWINSRDFRKRCSVNSVDNYRRDYSLQTSMHSNVNRLRTH